MCLYILIYGALYDRDAEDLTCGLFKLNVN